MEHRRRASLRYAGVGLAVVTLAGAVAAAARPSRPAPASVTVSVDGRSAVVQTRAASVVDVLRRAGIAIGAHDVVAPDLTAAVHDGTRIAVERGRPLTLMVDGVQRTIWVTQRSVGAAVHALGLRLRGAYLSASRSGRIPLSGTTVLVQLPHRVTLVADGHRRRVTTTAITVADLLAQRHVRLHKLDRLSVNSSRRPTDGMVVRVFRVGRHHRHVVRWLPFTTRWVADSDLYRGTHRLRQRGHSGRVDRWFLVTYVDGHARGHRLLRARRRPPVDRVVTYGTRHRPAPVVRSYPSSSGGLDWAALARCESGGNPGIVDPPYYGLYQFTLGTWASVGGSGRPSDASAAEQTYRARLLYEREGRSPWPVCGAYL